MVLPGQMNVSATGAFTYTIPVVVPPGTGGMIPALSLDYSSQNGDGFEGLGWSLSGMPTISRCPRTVAQDGVHGGLNFGIDGDGKDRFCMDGQRLVAISTGTYGADGMEYRTEIDGFSRIISYGSSGSGPAYFKVWTKSGQTLEFGNSPDSKLPLVAVPTPTIPTTEATGPAGTLRAWAVNKISDTKGNYLLVVYNGGGASNCAATDRTQYGELCPTQINYSGNANPTPPLTPYNSVQFVYVDRNDIAPTYRAGSFLQTTKLLRHIITCTSIQNPCPTGSIVADYGLDYNYATASTAQRNELKSVTLCDGSSHCLPATTFNWQGSRDKLILTDGTTGYPNGQFQRSVEGGYQSNLVPGDFNGDGLTDLVPVGASTGACGIFIGGQDGKSFTAGTFSVSYATGEMENGIYTPEPGDLCNDPDPLNIKPTTLDIDGDGFSDLAVKGMTSANTWSREIVRNDRSGSLTQVGPYFDFHDLEENADFNGDGRSDYFDVSSDSSQTVRLSNGDGTYSAGPSFTTLGRPTTIPSDFDADGCADLLAQGGNGNHLIEYMCNPATSEVTVPNWQGLGFAITLGDFNGDGLTDVLRTANSDPAALYLATGTGFTKVWTDPNGHGWDQWTIVAGDFNGDGKTDVLLVADDAGGAHKPIGTDHQLWVSTGAAFVQAVDQNGVVLTIPNNGGNADRSQNGHPVVTARVADWNNDGASDIWIQKPSGDTEYLFSYAPELISSVNNGIGAVTSVFYDRLNRNGSLYTRATDASGCIGSAPTSCTQNVDGPMYVVSEIDSSNGLGTCVPSTHANCYWSTYAYAGAKTDLLGRGFLGFSQMTVTDRQTNVVQTTNYLTAFPYTGLIASQTKVCPQGSCLTASPVTLSSTVNCYDTDPNCQNLPPGGSAPFVVELMKRTQSSNDTDGTALPTVTTAYTYDSYGNALTVAQNVSDGSAKVTTNTYTNDAANWLLGRLTLTTVQSTVPNQPTLTRTSAFDYYMTDNSGLLHDETIEPSDTSSTLCLYLNTAYQYDVFGNKHVSTSQGYNTCGAARATTSTYAYDGISNFGQFATSVQNALLQSETWDYLTGSNSGRSFGVPLSHTGPNGLTTSWQYDGFGRKKLELRPDTTQIAVAYTYCTALPTNESCPTNTAFDVIVTPQNSTGSQNGPITVTYYDSLSRALATDVEAFETVGSGCSISTPCWIRSLTTYDSFGRISKTSRPYFLVGGTAKSTVFSYLNTTGLNDPLGRVQKATPPGPNGNTVTAYSGLTTTVTNALNEITVTTKNAQGLVASVTDALALGQPDPTFLHTTRYVYDSEGDLLTVTDPAGNVTTNTFDLRGRKLTASDPDMGKAGGNLWSYQYDAFGELVQQTDAKGQVTTLSYDILGRVRHRVETAISGSFTSNWIYNDTINNVNHDVGQLIQACTRANNGTDCSGLASSDYMRALTYDATGRLATITLTIDGTPYTTTAHYNGDGRVDYVSRPSGLQVDNTYTSLGYLSQEKDHASGTAFWTANARDQELHLLQAAAGDGVVTTQSFDANTGLVQQIRAGVSDSVANFTYTFDKLGNLFTRKDALANSGAGLTETSCYDKLNRLTKYAVTTGTQTCSTGTNPKTVAYDSLGNITRKSDISKVSGYHYGGSANAGPHALTSIDTCTGCLVNGVTNPSFAYDANGNVTSGAGRSVTYTSFNMAASVVSGSTTLALVYDSEHMRTKQSITTGGVTTTTTYLYAMGQMEEKAVVGATATWRDYIQADGKIVAERFTSALGAATTSYFVLDHLGSVSVLTNDLGVVTERDAYDAWGKRRDPSTWADDPTCSTTSSATRGYTGHEEMDSVCLINANARVYDPTIARFMSADGITQDIYDLQSYNRYSYVGNNPLSLTDPSGNCAGILGCLFDIGTQDLDNILLKPIVHEFPIVGSIFVVAEGAACGPACAAGAAAEVAHVEGGSEGDILKAFAITYAEATAFEGIHVLKVGELGFPTDYADYSPTQVLESAGAHGLVGGLTSVAGGGKFEAGFLAAAFSDVAGGVTEGSGPSLGNVVSHAVVGGLGSVLGGGKFANGAVTGAFGYLFNEALQTNDRSYYARKMQACDFSDQNCIGRVLDEMEKNNQPLPFADPRKVLPEFFNETISAAATGAAGTLALGRLRDAIVASEAFGPTGSIFGRASRGGSSILDINANDSLRVGWGWKGSATAGEDVFRISGDWIRALGIRSGHIDIWSASKGWFPP